MSPISKEANQQVLVKRRNHILGSALKVFAEKGFSATKISNIASEAGLSHGLMYHYFMTKDEIFTELVRSASNLFLAITEYGAKYDTSPIEKIRIITEMIISIGYSRRSAYHLNIFEQAYISEGIPEAAKKIINDNQSSTIKLLSDILSEGQKLGQIIEEDPLKLAFAYYSMVRGMTGMQSKSSNFQDPPVSFSDSDIILRAISNPKQKQKTAIPQKNTGIFGPLQISNHSLKYRYRENSKADYLFYKETARKKISKERKQLIISMEMETGIKLIAIADPNDLMPVKIEFFDSTGKSLQKTEYKDNSVFFNSPEYKFKKRIKLTGLYYDHNTLPYLLRTYPFESNENIKFTMVLDGSLGLPIGPYGFEIKNLGAEMVKVPAGDFNCFKLEITPVGFDISRFYYWYPVEEPRYMVKRDILGFETELVEIKEKMNEKQQPEK
jgi:AcrR family transcriptional regulator